MARTYETSLENEKLLTLSTDEMIGMLVEAKWDDRQNRNLERRLRNARFRYQSSIENVDYNADRNLDRGQLLRFAECSFISKHENTIITGSTGIGKSYIATAIGHQACTLGLKVYYANLGKLFSRLFARYKGHVGIQRCLVHIQRMSRIWLTRDPRSPAGWELLSITQQMHKMIRRVRRLLINAISDMFHYLEDEQIPKSTNALESFFGHLKDNLSIHRGMSSSNRKNYIKGYLHLRN